MNLRSIPLVFALTVPILLLGCKDDPSGARSTGAPTPSATTSVAAASSSAAAATSAGPAASSAGAVAASPADGTWHGTGKSKVAEVTPPADAKVEIWKKDPGTDAIGDVTMKLTIAGPVVTGEISGALGTATLSGHHEDDVVSGRIDPKDPNQQVTWTGIFTGKIAGDHLDVKIRVSDRNANRARHSELKLAR